MTKIVFLSTGSFRVRISQEEPKILCFKFLSFLNKRFDDDDIMMMKIIKRRNDIV